MKIRISIKVGGPLWKNATIKYLNFIIEEKKRQKQIAIMIGVVFFVGLAAFLFAVFV